MLFKKWPPREHLRKRRVYVMGPFRKAWIFFSFLTSLSEASASPQIFYPKLILTSVYIVIHVLPSRIHDLLLFTLLEAVLRVLIPVFLDEIFLAAQIMFYLHNLTLMGSLTYCLSCEFLLGATNTDTTVCQKSLKNLWI